MFVPDVAVAGAVFKMLRSATRWAVVAAVAKLLAGLVSSVRLVAATVAVLTIGPVAAGLMCTVMVKGWVALGASVPKVQVTVPAVLMHPALAETKIGRASCREGTELSVEAEAPKVISVRAQGMTVPDVAS